MPVFGLGIVEECFRNTCAGANHMTAVKDSKKKKKGSQEKASKGQSKQGSKKKREKRSTTTQDTRIARWNATIKNPVVRRSTVVRQLKSLGGLCDSRQAKRHLRSIARLISANPKDTKALEAIESVLASSFDQADQASRSDDCWVLREGAVWGLAWLAQPKRASQTTGTLLNRCIALGEEACSSLNQRETVSAAFVLVLSRLFCADRRVTLFESVAVTALEEEIGRLVSSEGAVGLTGSASIVERICRWAHCRSVGATKKDIPWNETTDELFDASLAFGLRLLGRRGQLISSHGQQTVAPLLEAAQTCSARRKVRRTARALVSNKSKSLMGRGILSKDFEDSEAAMSVLRSGWTSDSVRVLVEYRDVMPRLEIVAGNRVMFDGSWNWNVTCDGESLQAEGPWELNCLESKRAATYFEIRAPLVGGFQIERSITVSCFDHVLILADAITQRDGKKAAGALSYSSSIPVVPSVDIEPAVESREIFLSDRSMLGIAMPLALPEWRSVGDKGDFVSRDGTLALSQQGMGRLFAPLWFDLKASRLGEQLTWRQITVADTRINLPPSMASGHRVQVGLDHWLLYRSLDAPRNRTLLGFNISSEYVLGRITPNGTVQRTIEIE